MGHSVVKSKICPKPPFPAEFNIYTDRNPGSILKTINYEVCRRKVFQRLLKTLSQKLIENNKKK